MSKVIMAYTSAEHPPTYKGSGLSNKSCRILQMHGQGALVNKPCFPCVTLETKGHGAPANASPGCIRSKLVAHNPPVAFLISQSNAILSTSVIRCCAQMPTCAKVTSRWVGGTAIVGFVSRDAPSMLRIAKAFLCVFKSRQLTFTAHVD